MRQLITAVVTAALLASSLAPSALAAGAHRHHGAGYGHGYHGGGHYKRHYKHRPHYWHRGRHHGGYGHYGFGLHGHFHGDDAWVALGVIAGAAVLGTLLSRPPPPARPVPRSPTGAPLGGCLKTTGIGTWHGNPARFTGTMCYDPAGQAYILPGTTRFAGHLR